MASSDALTPVALASSDVLAGVALSDAAGWNQTADDWQHFVAHGRAIGWRTARSELVATAATLPYGGVAWISMVLVDTHWQHRGLATGLLAQCVAQLQHEGLTPVLDATPAGEAVYRRMGFDAGFALARWEGDAASPASEPLAQTTPMTPTTPTTPPATHVRTASIADLDAIAALDRDASGLDRRSLLRSFLGRQGTRAWLMLDAMQRAVGFVIARAGRRAMQIGPLVAQGVAQAIVLLDAALARIAGRVFLDVPVQWTALTDALIARGFRRQRPFVRMALAATLPDCVARPGRGLFVLAGPEFG